MRLPALNGLRFRLLLLTLAAALPLAGLVLYNSAQHRASALAATRLATQNAAARAAAELVQRLENQRQLVILLAHLGDIASLNGAACQEQLLALLPSLPGYLNLGAATGTGDVFCSAIPHALPVNVAGERWFKGALSSGDFALGSYIPAGISGLGELTAGYPLRAANGQLQGVVFAALDPASLNRLTQSTGAPLGAAVSIVDGRGTILSRYPDPAAWAGKTLPDAPIIANALAQAAGTAEAPGVDGVPRLFAYAAVQAPGSASSAPRVIVGIASADAFAASNAELARNLAALALMLLLALALAIWANRSFVLGPLNSLQQLARRMAAGELGARASASLGVSELDQLAASFNSMAAALEQRDNRHRATEAQLTANAERAHALATVGRSLAQATASLQNVLDEMCRATADLVGDAVLITLLSDDAQAMVPSALYHPNPQALALLRQILPVEPQRLDTAGPTSPFTTREALLLPEVDQAPLRARMPPEFLPYLDTFGVHSLLAVPMRARGTVIGTLTLARGTPGHPYTTADQDFVQAIADHAALAVSNARLYQAAQDANLDLERRVAERTVEIQALNRDLERHAVELTAANKELEAFSYSVSHDLRAPLRSLDGFSLALLEDYGPQLDATAQDYLRRVRAASQRMAMLIDDLLDLAQVARGELKRAPVDLTALADPIAAELSLAQFGRQVHFSRPDALPANGDARLLRLLLENLLGNAWKFTSRKEQAHVELGMQSANGETAYYVRDDGAGFDMAYAQRLFGVFQRLHDQSVFPGTGVGLATVQRIVARHGGRVWAEGRVDAGATFYFTLGQTHV